MEATCDFFLKPTLFPARAGAAGAVGFDGVVFFPPLGAIGGAVDFFPGGTGGPDWPLGRPPLRPPRGLFRGSFVDFLGFLKGFDGSSLAPK